MNKNIIGILLAAGQSARFGSQKLLQPLPESQIPIAGQSARNLLEVLPNSIAVVRENDQELKSLLLETGISVVENPDAELGMGTSIRCAIESQSASHPDVQAWVIALADMPFIPVPVIKQVIDALQCGALLVAPEYNKQRGHPVGFSYDLTNELLNLQGDIGAKPIIEKHRSQLQLIEAPNNGVLRDIDHSSDLTS